MIGHKTHNQRSLYITSLGTQLNLEVTLISSFYILSKLVEGLIGYDRLYYFIYDLLALPENENSLKKSTYFTLREIIKLRTYQWFYRVSQSKFEAKIGQGVLKLWSDIKINKYIHPYFSLFISHCLLWFRYRTNF